MTTKELPYREKAIERVRNALDLRAAGYRVDLQPDDVECLLGGYDKMRVPSTPTANQVADWLLAATPIDPVDAERRDHAVGLIRSAVDAMATNPSTGESQS